MSEKILVVVWNLHNWNYGQRCLPPSIFIPTIYEPQTIGNVQENGTFRNF